MKSLRLVKKLGTDLTPAEEKQAAETLMACKSGLDIVRAYLEREVISIDKQLNDPSKLYAKEGDTHLQVACLLTKREVQMKLLNLLRLEVELDADHAGD